MIVRVFSAALKGVDATEVEIEVHEACGNPQMIIVGLPDTAVRESRDRVLTAIGNSGDDQDQLDCGLVGTRSKFHGNASTSFAPPHDF